MQLIIASLVFLFMLGFWHTSHAIIFIAPLFLIPVINLVAALIGLLSVPLATLAAIYSRLFKAKFFHVLGYVIGGLFLLALLTAAVLKIITPERPWF